MKRVFRLVFQFIFLFGMLGEANSATYEWNVVTKVTHVQPTHMPTQVSFKLESPVSATCGANVWMEWGVRGNTDAEKIANANAVYSTLMAALVSGKDVRVFGNDLNCEVTFIHMF